MSAVCLKDIWLKTVAPFTEKGLAEWEAIEKQYSNSKRYYHNLAHLAHMHQLLHDQYSGNIPLTTTLALLYHDFEYNPLRGNNEEQSAEYAGKCLTQWNVDAAVIQKVYALIIATKTHDLTEGDDETMLFLDADMAILGSVAAAYFEYSKKVRKEFSVYPDFIYKKGRRQFVESVLKKNHIYLTNHFRQKFEAQARLNLQQELNNSL